MLHIVNQSPSVSPALSNCLRIASPGDAVILIEGGVYAATLSLFETFQSSSGKIIFYAITADIQARGLESSMSDQVTLIDYTQFVDLTIAHHPIQSWL